MTIADAFTLHRSICVNYYHVAQCYICGRSVYSADEEYSFEGDLNYFLGDFAREYPVLSLDDEIEPTFYETPEVCNEYDFYHPSYNSVLCSQCDESSDFV